MTEKASEQGPPEIKIIKPGYATGYGLNHQYFLSKEMTQIAMMVRGSSGK